MPEDPCPWWLGPLLASPLRRLTHDPRRILGPYISSGMTVLEPGPGMGFFTLEIARRVGPSGRVLAVDIQPQMLSGLARRAKKAGLSGRIECRLAQGRELGVQDLHGSVDLVVAFAVVHELPDAGSFFRQSASALKSGGRLLLVEPAGRVSEELFASELEAARAAGFAIAEEPFVRRSLSALLIKSQPLAASIE